MFRYDSIRPLVQDRIREQETQWAAGIPAHEWDSTEGLLVDTSHGAFVQSEQREKTMIEQMRRMDRKGFRLSHLFWRYSAKRSGVPVV